MVVHSFLPNTGGVECYTTSLAKELISEGWLVSVFCPLLRSNQPVFGITRSKVDEIDVFQFAVNNDTLLDAISHPAKEQAFQEFLRANDFDIIHFQHTHEHMPFSFIKVARQLGKPVCLTLHDFWFICLRTHLYQEETHSVCSGPESPEKCCDCFLRLVRQEVTTEQRESLVSAIRFRQEYVRDLLRSVDYISSPSGFLRDTFYRFGFGNGLIAVSPLGISKPAPVPRQNNDTVTFGYIGTISTIKNVQLLTEAFSMTRGNARLMIYGTPLGNTMNLLRKSLQDTRIHYMGGYRPEDLAQIFSHFDAVVVPSAMESYCLTVREALAAGLPVIAAKVGGIPEIVEHGVNGLLFDPEHDDLTNILQQALDNPCTLKHLAPFSKAIRGIDMDAEEWQQRYLSLIVGRRDNRTVTV